MKHQPGFTLIELMVTLAVIAILVAVAFPSYQEHVKKGIRSQGQQFLLDVAQQEEQYFLDQKQYFNAIDSTPACASPPTLTVCMAIPTEVQLNYSTTNLLVGVVPGTIPPSYLLELDPLSNSILSRSPADGSLLANSQQQHWRAINVDSTPAPTDCLWEDQQCIPH